MSNFAKYKNEYLSWMEQTHHSSQTIEVRSRLLEYFFRWCDERGLINIEEISRSIVESYQRYLFKYRKANGEALVISSQTKRLTAVRAFYKYLSSKHYVIYNPAADIHLPKATFRLPRQIFSPEEVEQVMIQPDLSADLVPDGEKNKKSLHNVESEGLGKTSVGHCICMFLRECTGFVCMLARNGVVWLVSSSIERTYEGKQTGAFDA